MVLAAAVPSAHRPPPAVVKVNRRLLVCAEVPRKSRAPPLRNRFEASLVDAPMEL